MRDQHSFATFVGRLREPTDQTSALLASNEQTSAMGAKCRKTRLAQGLPADGPDDTECRSTCQKNLAYTDRDIDHLRVRLAALDRAATDPLAPRPLRERAAGQAGTIRATIERHERTRPTAHRSLAEAADTGEALQ